MTIISSIREKRRKLVNWVNLNTNKSSDDLLRIELDWGLKLQTRIYHRDCFDHFISKFPEDRPAVKNYRVIEKVDIYKNFASKKKYYCEICRLSSFPFEDALRDSKILSKRAQEDYRWTKMIVRLFERMIKNKTSKITISGHADYNPCSAIITKNNDHCTCGISEHFKHWDGKPQTDDIEFNFEVGFFDMLKIQRKNVDLWVLTIMTAKAFNEEDQEERILNSSKDCFDKSIVLPVKHLTREIVIDAVTRWVGKNIPQLANASIEWRD